MIDISSHELLYNKLDENCYCLLPDSNVRTASSAVVGAGVFAGASDGRTSFSSFGISEGVRSDTWDPEQGYKKPAVEFLVTDVFGEIIKEPLRSVAISMVSTNPSPMLPISIHNVGGILFAGLPGEFSTMLGRRIRSAIASAMHTSENRVSLVGLADAYTSYVTTPCEFNEQAYEGASNYFGLNTGQLFVSEYASLTAKLPDNMNDRRGRSKRYSTGSKVTFGPDHLGHLQQWNADEGLQNLLVSDDGKLLKSHHIPAQTQVADDTVFTISEGEAVAFSFEDSIKTLGGDGNFYPSVSLSAYNPDKRTGDTIDIPEMILTVDEYTLPLSTWTVRIPETSWLKGKKVQFQVKIPVTAIETNSAYFMRK